MSITGKKFLEVSRAQSFGVTTHALERMEQHLGFPLTDGLAHSLFNRSRQVSPEDIFLMGYRPAYTRRARAGIHTWYFLFHVFGQELVAIVSQDAEDGGYVWVTTYAPNRQTEQFRLVDAMALAAA